MAEERAAEAKRIGELIATLRERRGWTQQDLAHEIGVAVSSVSRWERGLHQGMGPNVRKLAKALEVSPEALLPAEPDTASRLERIEKKIDKLAEDVAALAKGDEILAAIREALGGL